MKLYTTDDMELMEVTQITSTDGRLLIAGTIMGAMPIEAVLTAAEMRKAIGLLTWKTALATVRMFLFR